MRERLRQAETIVDLEPDRCLKILDSIPSASLKSRRFVYRYTATRMKARISMGDTLVGVGPGDTMAVLFVSRYSQGGEEWDYYLGMRCLADKENRERGMVSLTRDVARMQGKIRRNAVDSIHLVRACQGLSGLFNAVGLPDHALAYASIGLEFADAADTASCRALSEQMAVSKQLNLSEEEVKTARWAWLDHRHSFSIARNEETLKPQKILLRKKMVALSVSFLVIILLFIMIRNWRRRREIAYLVLAGDQLRTEIKEKDLALEEMGKAQDRSEYLQTLFVNLFQKEFREIGNLCNVFLTDKGMDKEENIYREVQKIAGRFRTRTQSQTEFEKMLNRYLDNVMVKVRSDFPTMTETDYRFISYCIAGFSASFIAVLLPDMYVPSVYMKKTRLVRKLVSCDSPNASLYRSVFHSEPDSNS